jgi:hypothetical protein
MKFRLDIEEDSMKANSMRSLLNPVEIWRSGRTARLSIPGECGEYTSSPFPVFLLEDRPLLFNVHSLYLDDLPKLKLARRIDWLETMPP